MILILLGKKSMKTTLEDESGKGNDVKGEESIHKKDKIFMASSPVFLFIFFNYKRMDIMNITYE